MESIGIYQVVHTDLVVPYLDDNFLQLDWRANPAPELRELAVHDHVGQSGLYRRHDLTGAISPKFYAKTHLRAAQVRDWIAANPGHEVYLICGYPFIPYLAFNSVERGRVLYDMDFETVMRDVCERIGFTLPEDLWRQTNRNSAYASYWVAGRDFWKTWSDDVIAVLMSPSRLGARLYEKVHSLSHYHAPSAPPVYLAPFIYEALISIYISMKKVDALYYDWSNAAILSLNIKPEVVNYLGRVMPGIDAIDAARDWNRHNRAALANGYLALCEEFQGPEFNASNPDNFSLPSTRLPGA